MICKEEISEGRKYMKNENTDKVIPAWRFVTKVMVYHIVTYIICGMIFSHLMNYKELFELGNMKYYMRPAESIHSMVGPFFQFVRGLLFGVVLLMFRKNILTEKNSFLKLWALIVTLGIINTPGPAPSSIEGFIYTQVPLKFCIFGSPEILVQTFWFSYLVSGIDKKRERKVKPLNENIKRALINSIICVTGYSVSGIILSILLHVEVSSSTTLQSYIILGITAAVCFVLSLWYIKRQNINKPIYKVLFYSALYILCAVCPFIINMVTESPLQTPASLFICALPVIGMALYMERHALKAHAL